MDHVEELRATVRRLRAEVKALRQRAEQAEQKLAASKNTQAANKVRSTKAARLDARVISVLKDRLGIRSTNRSPARELLGHGFPRFYHNRGLRRAVADALNGAEVKAPRGGQWTERQVQRAFDRYAERFESSKLSLEPDGN